MCRVGVDVGTDEDVLELLTTTDDEELGAFDVEVEVTVDDFDVETTTLDEEDLTVEVETTLDELGLLLEVEETTLLLLDASEVSLYNSSLFPAPQYSKALPGQVKLQSPIGAGVEVASRVLPQ